MRPQHGFELRNHQTLPKNEVPCYACKEFRALKAKGLFSSCILFEYRARNFIFWKGLVIPQIKTMLRPHCNVSTLDYNLLGYSFGDISIFILFLPAHSKGTFCLMFYGFFPTNPQKLIQINLQMRLC